MSVAEADALHPSFPTRNISSLPTIGVESIHHDWPPCRAAAQQRRAVIYRHISSTLSFLRSFLRATFMPPPAPRRRRIIIPLSVFFLLHECMPCCRPCCHASHCCCRRSRRRRCRLFFPPVIAPNPAKWVVRGLRRRRRPGSTRGLISPGIPHLRVSGETETTRHCGHPLGSAKKKGVQLG